MLFGAVGDLHGDFDALARIMARHPDVAMWLCPGDLPGPEGEYPQPPAPLYWIHGNNEDFDFVAAQPPGGGTLAHLHFIPNGTAVEAPGLRLAGLGGTFAPTWYESPRTGLPAGRNRRVPGGWAGAPASGPDPLSRDDKRRHFVHDEVAACMRLTAIDVFLSHEAARSYVLETGSPSPSRRRLDAGKTAINDVLAAMRPRLHLFGHHHKYTVAERQGVPSIGLEKASDGYLVFDGRTLAHQRLAS